jgi:CHASE2 domain-containing sensor protein/signal transduction histidine kinase
VIGLLRRIDRLTAEWWLVLLAALGLVAACVATSFPVRFDMLLYDQVQRSLPHRPHPDILLVSIDDRSLAEVGPWPWPRSNQAQLLTALAVGKPHAVALDVLLLDEQDPVSDAALAKAIAEGPPTYLPVEFQLPGRNGASFEIVEPAPPFRNAAKELGQANLNPDADGIVRRAYLEYAAGTAHWPHLMTWLSGTAKTQSQDKNDPNVVLAKRPAMIAYTGPQGSFPNISAASVLRGELPPEALAGKLVLVGATATGIGDSYSTPVGGDGTLMSGLEIQANLLDSLLSNRVISPAGRGLLYVFALTPIVLMMLGLRYLKPGRTLWLLGGLLFAVLAVSLLLLRQGLWVAPGSALIGLIAVYPLWNWRRLATVSAYFATELEKLESEHDPLERARPNLTHTDFVDRQMGLLRSAIDRERDLRRFFIDRIAQMPDAVVVTDLAGRVVLANDVALTLWRSMGGSGELRAVDHLLSQLKDKNGKPPLGPGTINTWQSAPLRSDVTASDGRCFAMRCEPQRAADDAVIGAVVRIADTTEATRIQREREEVMQLLSHDMRSPQVSILTLLNGANARTIKAPLAERIRDYAERTLHLADGFVQLSRAQSLRFEPQVIDISDVAREAMDALWPQANASGVSLIAELPEDELLVQGEGSLLTRMLVNLIDNAIRYSKQGQKVRVSVVLEASEADPWCRITVADQGPGISPERLQQLYQRFQSSGGGIAQGKGGVGLGLAFVHATVLRHNGSINCNSDAERGTSFEILIPAYLESN